MTTHVTKKKFVWAKLDDAALDISSTDDVTPKVLATLYHLDKFGAMKAPKTKRKQNNAQNPNDFFTLGEDDPGALILTKGLNNPTADVRDGDAPVGLKNLGATCYMNSLLQSLFMNTKFRDGVYRWKGAEDDTKGIVFELQQLFASLQSGNKRFYDPTPFTNQLDLKVEVQQDAQEFYKALISYLEEKFEKGANEGVKHLIQEQFQGKSAYVTTCSGCKKPSKRDSLFYEVEIHLEGIKTLEQGIEKYIGEEQMTGSDQYMCNTCEAKHDATRRICFTELPEVLNLQLMRFLFDYGTGRKKKVRSPLAFPKQLDMRKYLDPDSINPEQEYIYELSSVLIHKGPSAYGGHYIAIIRDEHSNMWWRFDDDRATSAGKDIFKTMLDTQNEEHRDEAVVVDDNDDEVKEVKKPKGKGKASSAKKSAAKMDVDADFTSDDVVVVDEEKEEKEEKDEDQLPAGYIRNTNAYMLSYTRVRKPVKPEPAKETLERVEDSNSKFAKVVDSFKDNKKEREDQHQAFVAQFAAVWNDIAVESPDVGEKCYWISTDWLKKFVKGDSLENSVTCNSDLVCEHNMISFYKINRMKRISPHAWEFFKQTYQCAPELSHEMYCKECLVQIIKDERELQEDLALRTRLLTPLKDLGADWTPSKKEKAFYIDREWFNKFKAKKLYLGSMTDKVNEGITCEHSGLVPDPKKSRLVPENVWKYIKAKYPNVVKEWPYDDETEYCVLCSEAFDKTERDTNERRERIKSEKTSLKKLFNSIKGHFNPDKKSPSTTFCKTPAKGGKYYALSLDWARKWFDFVEDKSGLIAEAPAVGNKEFFCTHHKTLFDPSALLDDPTNEYFVLIDKDTFEEITGLYSVEDEKDILSFTLTIKKKAQRKKNAPAKPKPKSRPKPKVSGSRQSARLTKARDSSDSFDIDDLDDDGGDDVELLDVDDDDDDEMEEEGGARFSALSIKHCDECIEQRTKEDEQDAILFKGASFELAITDIRGKRRHGSGPDDVIIISSSRTRQKKVTVHGVNHTDTVGNFQLKVFQAQDIPPNEQMIFFGQEKLEPRKQLKDYGITTSSVLKLTRTDPTDSDDFSDYIPHQSEYGLGFGGTALSGKKKSPKAGAVDVDAMAVEKEWTCVCTTVNPGRVLACTICNTPMDEAVRTAATATTTTASTTSTASGSAKDKGKAADREDAMEEDDDEKTDDMELDAPAIPSTEASSKQVATSPKKEEPAEPKETKDATENSAPKGGQKEQDPPKDSAPESNEINESAPKKGGKQDTEHKDSSSAKESTERPSSKRGAKKDLADVMAVDEKTAETAKKTASPKKEAKKAAVPPAPEEAVETAAPNQPPEEEAETPAKKTASPKKTGKKEVAETPEAGVDVVETPAPKKTAASPKKGAKKEVPELGEVEDLVETSAPKKTGSTSKKAKKDLDVVELSYKKTKQEATELDEVEEVAETPAKKPSSSRKPKKDAAEHSAPEDDEVEEIHTAKTAASHKKGAKKEATEPAEMEELAGPVAAKKAKEEPAEASQPEEEEEVALISTGSKKESAENSTPRGGKNAAEPASTKSPTSSPRKHAPSPKKQPGAREDAKEEEKDTKSAAKEAATPARNGAGKQDSRRGRRGANKSQEEPASPVESKDDNAMDEVASDEEIVEVPDSPVKPTNGSRSRAAKNTSAKAAPKKGETDKHSVVVVEDSDEDKAGSSSRRAKRKIAEAVPDAETNPPKRTKRSSANKGD